jgi:alpha-tubulin suppressor-like RCC1 family protein
MPLLACAGAFEQGGAARRRLALVTGVLAVFPACTPLLAGNDIVTVSDGGGDVAGNGIDRNTGRDAASAYAIDATMAPDSGANDATADAVRPFPRASDGASVDGDAPDAGADGGPATCAGCPPPPLARQLSSWNARGCALLDGGVWCWGHDPFAPDGGSDGTTGAIPVAMDDGGPLTGVVQVAVGYEHVCALRGTGDVLCWGDQVWGETGFQSADPRPRPGPAVPAPAGRSFTAIAAKGAGGMPAGEPQGGLSCAIDDEAGVWCWGMDDHGALGPEADPDGGRDAGDAAPSARSAPVKIDGVGGALEIALDDAGGCVMTPNGVLCWGWNRDGELSDSGVDSPLPTGRGRGPPVWAGHATLCAPNHNVVNCWGDNSEGQLGLGPDAGAHLYDVTTPFGNSTGIFAGEQELTRDAIDVAIGWGHACVVAFDSTLWCAGRDSEYELGRGFRSVADSGPCPSCQSVPVRVAGPNAGAAGPLVGVREIAAGWASTCAMTSDGVVYCWGFNGDAVTGGATGHAPGTMGDVPCDPPPFLAASGTGGPAYCTPYPTEVVGLGGDAPPIGDGGSLP